MSNMNKIISFVLGLVVVIIFVAVISGRLNIGKRFTALTKSGTTATVTPKPSIAPTSSAQNNTYNRTPTVTSNSTQKYTTTNQTTNGVNSIPKTGAETALIPTALSMLAAGIFLRRKSK